jgi:molybdopterin/thiamine biosynthesis adenylyltransferase
VSGTPRPGPGDATVTDDLDDGELLRYSRQIVLREVGGSGQLRLRHASVAVVGAGGLGSPVLLYLAAAGVGSLTVIDDDAVSLDNLGRQILFTTADVGSPKAAVAAGRLRALNDGVDVAAVSERLDTGSADRLLAGHDLVVEASDGFATKLAVNDACVRLGIPAVVGGVLRFEGQVLTVVARKACYRCLVPEEPDPGLVPTCRAAGVLGAVAGTVGALQASEALRLLLGAGEPQGGQVLVVEALRPRVRAVPLAVDPRCPNHAAA